MNKLYTISPETGRWLEIKELFYAREIKNLTGDLIENPKNILGAMSIVDNRWRVVDNTEKSVLTHDNVFQGLADFTDVINNIECRSDDEL